MLATGTELDCTRVHSMSNDTKFVEESVNALWPCPEKGAWPPAWVARFGRWHGVRACLL